MKKQTKILICDLAIFIVGATLGFAFMHPVETKKYENKNNITVEVKDGEKIIKVNCKYENDYKQYLGSKKENGKTYSVSICYEEKDGMQGGKKGWWTSASNAGMADGAKTGWEHNENHPVTKIELH